MRTKRSMSALLSIGVVTIAATIASAPAASAIGGPCGQGGNGSLGSMTGSLGSMTGSLSGSAATGSLMNALPWITGAPNGALPVLRGRTQAIEMVTGPGSPNNTINRFSVSGTDLGIMWDNGLSGPEHGVQMVFGDTVGDCDSPRDDWRSNVLFRSINTDIAKKFRIESSPKDGPNHSKEIIPRPELGLGYEFTTIPTAGVSYDGVQYIRFMSVRSWDVPGEWTTNYSGLASSTDNGETWELEPAAVRVNSPIDIPGFPPVSSINKNFQQSAFLDRRVEDGGDGYIYEYGTPSGRSGGALVSRVHGVDIRKPNAYEYWNGSTWSSDSSTATQVIKSPVSELSVQWNEYLNKYIAMYTSPLGLVLSQADHPEGPWSGAQVLVSGAMVPGIYGGFMHPWASRDGSHTLEFVVTTWDRYNVIYMQTDLRGMDMSPWDSRDRPDPVTTGEAELLEMRMPEEQ